MEDLHASVISAAVLATVKLASSIFSSTCLSLPITQKNVLSILKNKLTEGRIHNIFVYKVCIQIMYTRLKAKEVNQR